MAKIDLGNKKPSDAKETGFATTQTTDNTATAYPQDNSNNEFANGLDIEEQRDPNQIRVTIEDSETPIVVLFGPPSSGKTMTLVRLTRFLQQTENCTVSPIKTFRPSADKHYQELCESYNTLVNSDNAAMGTDSISFMLLKVYQENARPICQILEAPGEYYYSLENPKRLFPNYVLNIINNNNRKIWIILLEPDWKDNSDRLGYVEKIKSLKTRLKPQDKIIFLYNKIDTTPFQIGRGRINVSEAQKNANNLYTGLFAAFKNTNPITNFFRKYNCHFIPFSTGDYNIAMDGTTTYQQSADEYPRELWNRIYKCIRG